MKQGEGVYQVKRGRPRQDYSEEVWDATCNCGATEEVIFHPEPGVVRVIPTAWWHQHRLCGGFQVEAQGAGDRSDCVHVSDHKTYCTRTVDKLTPDGCSKCRYYVTQEQLTLGRREM